MYASTTYQIAKARVADMQHDAQRDALARTARAARDTRKQQSRRSAPRIPALAARRLLTALGARA